MNNPRPSPYMRGAGDFDPPEPGIEINEVIRQLAELMFNEEDLEVTDDASGVWIDPVSGDAWVNAAVRIPKEDFTHA